MLIINANIKTMEDEDFENGYIAVFDGKIQSVGPMSEAPPDEDVYDLTIIDLRFRMTISRNTLQRKN